MHLYVVFLSMSSFLVKNAGLSTILNDFVKGKIKKKKGVIFIKILFKLRHVKINNDDFLFL